MHNRTFDRRRARLARPLCHSRQKLGPLDWLLGFAILIVAALCALVWVGVGFVAWWVL